MITRPATVRRNVPYTSSGHFYQLLQVSSSWAAGIPPVRHRGELVGLEAGRGNIVQKALTGPLGPTLAAGVADTVWNRTFGRRSGPQRRAWFVPCLWLRLPSARTRCCSALALSVAVAQPVSKLAAPAGQSLSSHSHNGVSLNGARGDALISSTMRVDQRRAR